MNISFWFSIHELIIETNGPQGKETFQFPYELLGCLRSAHGPSSDPLFSDHVLKELSSESHCFNFHKNPPNEQVEVGNIPTSAWEGK